MGLFDFLSSSSTATDERIAGTDQAHIIRGQQNVQSEGQSQAVGTHGKLLNPGAVDLAGSKNAQIGGLQISGAKGNITLGVGGGDLANITSQFSDTINKLSQSSSDLVGSVLSQQSATVGEALSKVSDLAAGSQTGGQTYTDKTLLYLALGAFAVLAAVFYFMRR